MAGPAVNYYVDPSIKTNGGSGTVGSPWTRATGSVVQYALDTIVAGSTGTRINVKAGADDVLTSSLSVSAYGTPSVTNPLIISGYTSAANDGGQGSISGGGSVAIWNNGRKINFQHMKLHNCGSAAVVTMDQSSSVISCEITNTSGNGIVGAEWGPVMGCYIHDVGGIGIQGAWVHYNYLADGTKKFTHAIADLDNAQIFQITNNIVNLTGTGNGIRILDDRGLLISNSILASAGTGKGIYWNRANARTSVCMGNLVEGFSGTGGTGIHVSEATNESARLAYNAVFNCATAYTTMTGWFDLGGNETLGASPFSKTGANTYANRHAFFAPADVGNVRTKGVGGAAKGAWAAAFGGGGGLIPVYRSNSLITR